MTINYSTISSTSLSLEITFSITVCINMLVDRLRVRTNECLTLTKPQKDSLKFKRSWGRKNIDPSFAKKGYLLSVRNLISRENCSNIIRLIRLISVHWSIYFKSWMCTRVQRIYSKFIAVWLRLKCSFFLRTESRLNLQTKFGN